MKTDKALKLKARWEIDTFPAGKETQRGLLIKVTGRKLKDQVNAPRPPINLALVIDRSGSMANGRLDAARKAAIGISKHLGKDDCLSIVAFDDEISVLLEGVPQNKAGRAAAQAAISELQPRDCTDLAGGWMMGATCVAKIMETKGLANGHVLLLSDGHANRGITDPNELARHAGELAARGVSSSCVGIGTDYSALQLDAIAEAGNGNLHHSSDPDEIIQAVLGEIGEMTQLVAHGAELHLHFPPGTRPRQLTRFKESAQGHELKLRLGDMVSGRTRSIAFMVDVENGMEAGLSLPFTARLSWKQGEALTEQQRVVEFALNAVNPAEFDPETKRKNIARIIAELWLARMGYESMLLNERGLYREAVEVFSVNDASLEELVKDLKKKQRDIIMKSNLRARSAVAEEWSGPSKLEAFSLSKKFMRSENDHTSRAPEDWSDNIPG